MFAAVLAAGLLVASATVASAQLTRTTPCLGACHAAGPGATVAASLVSTTATSATYDLTLTGAAGSAWAVFDGSTKLQSATTTIDTFTVERGKTYDVFAVDSVDPFNSATTSVSPAAPSVEPTASLDETVPPVTTSDAKASYVGTATVEFEATDAGGQGVAYIYYSIDGGRVHLYTVGMISEVHVDIAAPIVGSANHTIAFWSQDMAGNVEAPNTVTIAVAASPVSPLPVVRTLAKLTEPNVPSDVRRYQRFSVTGYITPLHRSGSHVIELRFYRYSTKHHRYVYSKTLRPDVHSSVFDNYSKYKVTTSLSSRGKWRVRAVHSDALHLTSYSTYDYVYVH